MIAETVVLLAGFALVHLLAVVSPGPSFMLVAQAAIGSGRRAGLMAALGTTIAAVAWAAAALCGLQALFQRFDWLYTTMRIGGALYLFWIAWQLWRHAGDPLPRPEAGSPTGAGFTKALLLGLSNPKIMVFFGSIFLSLLPANPPSWMEATALAIVAVNEFAWYAAVTFLFSAGPARGLYGRAKLWLDRIMGGVLGALGLKLVLDR